MAKTAELTRGFIRSLHNTKGFGFIEAEDGQQYFFHKSAVRGATFDELIAGDPVQFEPGQGDKGPRTNLVRPTV